MNQSNEADVSVLIKLPSPLRPFAADQREVTVDASNVAAAILALDALHPGLAIKICNEQSHPRPHILIYVNEESIRELQGMNTPLKSGDVLHIFPAVSGG